MEKTLKGSKQGKTEMKLLFQITVTYRMYEMVIVKRKSIHHVHMLLMHNKGKWLVVAHAIQNLLIIALVMNIILYSHNYRTLQHVHIHAHTQLIHS